MVTGTAIPKLFLRARLVTLSMVTRKHRPLSTVYSTKWGWVTNVEAGSNTTQNGFVLGEDSSGLFHLSEKYSNNVAAVT